MSENNKRILDNIKKDLTEIEKNIENDNGYNTLLKDIEVYIERKKIEIIKAL
jgi:hypothetical protein